MTSVGMDRLGLDLFMGVLDNYINTECQEPYPLRQLMSEGAVFMLEYNLLFYYICQVF